MTKPLNKFQIAVAKVHGGGDYAYIIDVPPDEAVAVYEDCGDTLFTFFMRELSDDVGSMRISTALQRMETARREVQDAIDAIERL